MGVLIETSSGSFSESFSGEIVKSAMAFEPSFGREYTQKTPVPQGRLGITTDHVRSDKIQSDLKGCRSDPTWRDNTTLGCGFRAR